MSWLLYGLTVMASDSSQDAPANSLKINTDFFESLVAINSLAIKFIQSLMGVTKAISQAP